MTTARIVKLNAGESLSLMVESATEVEGQYGQQVKFDGQTAEGENVTVFLSLDAAQRQLERIGATVDSIAGSIIKLEKVAKNGKTFWNIYRAGGANKVAARPTPPPPAEPDWLADQEADEENFVASVKTDKLTSIVVLHRKCFTHALSLATSWEKTGVTASLEGVSALTAQLFIAAREAGL